MISVCSKVKCRRSFRSETRLFQGEERSLRQCPRCRTSSRMHQVLYRKTEAGRASTARSNASEVVKARKRAYEASIEGKERRRQRAVAVVIGGVGDDDDNGEESEEELVGEAGAVVSGSEYPQLSNRSILRL
jgi:hypothetical protein